MGERFRAQRAWRDLVGRRYGGQVSVTQRDVDRVLSSAATEAGDDTVDVSNVSAAFIGVYSGVGSTIAGVTDHDQVFGSGLTSRSSVDVVSLAGDDDVERIGDISLAKNDLALLHSAHLHAAGVEARNR